MAIAMGADGADQMATAMTILPRSRDVLEQLAELMRSLGGRREHMDVDFEWRRARGMLDGAFLIFRIWNGRSK
jgi:hypothetical protein